MGKITGFIEIERRAASGFFQSVLKKKDVAFLISFAVISAAWRDHYYLFRQAKGTDASLLLLDCGWLLE